MKTVAIISEYNPFHSGHLYQIQRIREEFGEDTRIVAIMSGNFTQRAEVAIADKSARAKMAVLSGVNLVLELPFPYSMGSAELFARAGVSIAEGLGCIDVLSFGSECGDISLLTETAALMRSTPFLTTLDTVQRENSLLGHAKVLEITLAKYIGADNAKALLCPNNILALEYLKAIKDLGGSIIPHTIARNGADYRCTEKTEDTHQSAGAIRKSLLEDNMLLSVYIPKAARAVLAEEIDKGAAPCKEEKLSSAILSYFRLNKPTASCKFMDAKGGLYNRLITKSYEAHDISSLAALTETKKFTNARIRRAIWFSFFGVTSSEAKTLPKFTRVLALDKVGQSVLRDAKSQASISVFSKPSERPLCKETAQQKELADRADAVFQLTKPDKTSGSYAMLTSPFFKG